MTRTIACEHCGRTTTAQVREQTNPRDYSYVRRVLCETCARTLGFGNIQLRPPVRSSELYV